MPGWLDKVLHFIGFGDNYTDEDEDDPQQVVESGQRKRAPVLSLHSSPDLKIVVMSPESFEESEKLAGHLKNRRPVIVNFDNTSKEIAQRIIDFLSGAVFALNGGTWKVTAETFLFMPSNISIYSEALIDDQREHMTAKWDQGGIRDRFQEKD